ncbi:cell division protein PerM, partial [Subtercola frigoramans]
MNRPTTALLAALDALLTVALGIGIPLVMLTVLWATQFSLSIDWLVFWRAAADVWMLGNGVDVLISLDAGTAAQLALDHAAVPFEIGIAPLGFAVLTAFLGRRSGLRLGLTEHPFFGGVVGTVTVGVLAGLICVSAHSDLAVASLRQAVVFVPATYAVGLLAGGVESIARTQSPLRTALRERLDALPTAVRSVAAAALRCGAAIAVAMVGVGALAVALLLLVNYSTVVSLYESLQSGIAGGAALTIAQIAFMPNLAIWAASWMLGPGFALGTGTSVSPLGTQLGLVPSLPVFGALPHSSAIGFLALLIPVVVTFCITTFMRSQPGVPFALTVRGIGRTLGTGFATALVAAGLLALLAMWSGGALGPGRLADVGPDPSAVFLWVFVSCGVSASAG